MMIKKIRNRNAGMTYVELIVVLSIFAIMSGVVIYDYGGFQAKVDIKNLASDIALKIVEAQKTALSGTLSTSPFTSRPAYGVYFDTSTTSLQKQFIYFADLNNDKIYNDIPLDTILITKNNYIDKIDKCISDPCPSGSNSINLLSIIFTRPNSSAVFSDLAVFNYIQITVKSPQGATALIKVYPSGRVQVN